jgi:hypothetical protein
MCDNLTFGYWGTNAPTRIDFNTARHTEYPCPLVSSTEGDVGFNYEQMAYYATKAGYEEMAERSTLQPYFANALPQAETYGVNWRDIMAGEGIWNNSSTPYIPFDVRYLRKYRAYAGKKMLTFLQQAYSWSTWTYAITEKFMCRCGYVGAIPSFGRELSGVTDGYFEYPTIIERDRPLFKK